MAEFAEGLIETLQSWRIETKPLTSLAGYQIEQAS